MSINEVHNYWETPVQAEVLRRAGDYPEFDRDLLADVACVALNRLPVKYVRFSIDLIFYRTSHEETDSQRALMTAVDYAFSFIADRTSQGLAPRQTSAPD
jgi:hypothetical protein